VVPQGSLTPNPLFFFVVEVVPQGSLTPNPLFFFVVEVVPQGSLTPNPLFFFEEEEPPAIPPCHEQVPLPVLRLIVPSAHKVFAVACGDAMGRVSKRLKKAIVPLTLIFLLFIR
jgi:hypothetical protein